MIVRETPEGFLLIAQHAHGLVSGVFARNLSPAITKGRLTKGVLDAIANHDRAWQKPDSEVLWNEAEDRPCSFLDHPPEPKTTAYTAFLDGMEAEDEYSALLCSSHYGSLVGRSEDTFERRFAAAECIRRERIRARMSEAEMSDFRRDFAVLQFSDDLSLFLCLNEPGANEYPWFTGGLSFLGEKIMPVWRDAATLTFEPYPFYAEFVVEVPYRIVGRDGVEHESGSYEITVAP